MKIEGVLNYETQSDSHGGPVGYVNVRICPFQRAPALQQLEPVELDAEQRPEREKEKKSDKKQDQQQETTGFSIYG